MTKRDIRVLARVSGAVKEKVLLRLQDSFQGLSEKQQGIVEAVLDGEATTMGNVIRIMTVFMDVSSVIRRGNPEYRQGTIQAEVDQ